MYTVNLNYSPITSFKADNHETNVLNIEGIRDMDIPNFRVSGANIVSGGTLSDRSYEDFEKIKTYGVTSIVDYRGDSTPTLQRKCSEVGIDYFNFPLDGVDSLNNETYFVKINNKKFVTDSFVNKLNEYFSIMNSQKVYSGCQYGIDRTNIGLVLDYFINPKVAHDAPQILTWPGESKKTTINKLTKMTKKILRAMTPEQRRTLGLSEMNNDFTNSQMKKLVRRYKRGLCY